MYRIRTVFTGVTGSPWVSTAFFGASGGTPSQAVTALGTFWSAVDNLMDSSVSWSTLADVETVNSANGQVTAVTNTTPVAGGGGGGATGVPIAAQGLVRWRTGMYVNGREIRGRWFIPGLATGSNSDGVVTPASVTTMQNAAAALIADATSDLVIWSRKNHNEPSVVSASTWTQFAVLRSRRD